MRDQDRCRNDQYQAKENRKGTEDSSLAALFRDSKFKKALELRSDEATLSSIIKELD